MDPYEILQEIEDAPKSFSPITLAAYLRLLGHNQIETARIMGYKNPTKVAGWEASDEWDDARDIAIRWWLTSTADASRMTILRAIKKGHIELSRWFLERTDPKFAPPKKEKTYSVPWHMVSWEQAQRLASGESWDTIMHEFSTDRHSSTIN